MHNIQNFAAVLDIVVPRQGQKLIEFLKLRL